MSAYIIERRPALIVAIRLLDAAGLPTSDLTDAHMEDFFHSGTVGVVGVELFGRDALLRSLVVAADHRGLGLGSALVARAESHARARGARTIFLLTTTAEGFFKCRGYVPADRGRAPESIRASREFAELCPANSAFLFKNL